MTTLKDLKRLIQSQYADNRAMKKAFNRMVMENGSKNKTLSSEEIDHVYLRGGVRKSSRKRKKKEIFTYPEDWIDHGDEESDEEFDEEDGEEEEEDEDDGPIDKKEREYLKKASKKDEDYVFEDDTDDDDEEAAMGSEDMVGCVDRCLGKGETGLQKCLVDNCKVCDVAPTSSSDDELGNYTETLFDSDDED
tara:strand:+ start:230 stop:805 length:576 start_codon:yes stop_codon:yes gene_type:complete